jgi:hypothetical protein
MVVRLTRGERADFAQFAAAKGLTLSSWMRMMLKDAVAERAK